MNTTGRDYRRANNQAWSKIVQNKNDKPMLYVRLKNALYGTLQVALLLWRQLSNTLIEWGFK